jgi:transposase
MSDQPPVPEISADDWAATPASVRAVVLALLQQVQPMPHLTERVADLEARLNQHSGNSSKPPSSDPPSAPPKPTRTPRGNPRGGQPGHAGQHRPLLPPDQVDEFVLHQPTACPRCQIALPADLPPAMPPQRHQVTEVPPIQPHVTEHQLAVVCCPQCRQRVRADLPRDVPTGAFGARLTALIGMLHGRYRLSTREVGDLLADLVGVTISLGSVVTAWQQVSAALAPVYAAADAALPRSGAVRWP